MTSKLINIGGKSNDANYRYKRNVIEISYVKAGGSGGCTQITNLVSVWKQLKLGGRVGKEFESIFFKSIKEKKGTGIIGKNLLKGKVSSADIEAILEKLITKHLICKKCGLPELNLEDKKCRACGDSSAPTNRQPQQEEKQTENDPEAGPELLRAINRTEELYSNRHKHFLEYGRCGQDYESEYQTKVKCTENKFPKQYERAIDLITDLFYLIPPEVEEGHIAYQQLCNYFYSVSKNSSELNELADILEIVVECYRKMDPICSEYYSLEHYTAEDKKCVRKFWKEIHQRISTAGD